MSKRIKKNLDLSGGTRQEIINDICQHTLECFVSARDALLPVHDHDIKMFALQKALEYPNFRFVASDRWILEWKKQCGITSRKIQKIVSFKLIRNNEDLVDAVTKFREEFKHKSSLYHPSFIYNTDQTGFRYEVVGNRTLSYKGERRTLGSALSPKNKMTHSYTVQYTISANGNIVGDVFIYLQVKFQSIVE